MPDKVAFNRLKRAFGTTILFLILLPVICEAQLPYYPPVKSSDSNTYIGVDFYTFGLPISLVITSEINKNTIRFGASPSLPNSDRFSFNGVDAKDITVYLAYTRLFGNENGFIEFGGAVLGGSESNSGGKRFAMPAFGLIAGLHLTLTKKILLRADFTPIFNFTDTKFTAGFGFSYRL